MGDRAELDGLTTDDVHFRLPSPRAARSWAGFTFRLECPVCSYEWVQAYLTDPDREPCDRIWLVRCPGCGVDIQIPRDEEADDEWHAS